MSVDIDANRKAIADTFDQYLEEMLGEESYAYNEFVAGHFLTKGKRKQKLQHVHNLMQTQRDILLDYAAERVETADDNLCCSNDDSYADAANTQQYVNDFLDSNPFLSEFHVDSAVEPQVEETLTDHFFYLADELEDLLQADVLTDTDNRFGAVLRDTYDTADEAQDVLQENFAYTDRLQEYVSHIHTGHILDHFINFERDIFPKLAEGEQQLQQYVHHEIDSIYHK